MEEGYDDGQIRERDEMGMLQRNQGEKRDLLYAAAVCLACMCMLKTFSCTLG